MSSPPSNPPLPEGPYKRRTARVLLVNAKNELLLFEWPHRQLEGRTSWSTPGGGIDGDEPVVAAARELYEETGLSVSPDELGEPVATAVGYADLGWAKGAFRDDFFFHRVDHHEVDQSASLEYERKTIVSTRWWTLQELDETAERVVPFGLAPLLADLLTGTRPDPPVVLPWHHSRHSQDPADYPESHAEHAELPDSPEEPEVPEVPGDLEP
jgi:8-oxo-dGTP pyrophosphatase MutT (NUDIX family)